MVLAKNVVLSLQCLVKFKLDR